MISFFEDQYLILKSHLQSTEVPCCLDDLKTCYFVQKFW